MRSGTWSTFRRWRSAVETMKVDSKSFGLLLATPGLYVFGEGRQSFQPADVTTLALHGQYALTQALAVQAGVDSRYAGENTGAGVKDTDSGGAFAMASLGVSLRLQDDVLIHGGAQLPLAQDPNGYQREGTSLSIGL